MTLSSQPEAALPAPKVLILDIDGTLLSSVPRAEAMSAAFAKIGFPLSAVRILQDTKGSFSFDSISKQFGLFPASAYDKADQSAESVKLKALKAKVFQSFKQNYLKALAEEPHPEKWLATGLDQLTRAYPNALLVVTTNAEDGDIAEASCGIVERAMGRKFDKIFHSGMLPGKPAPAMAEAALAFAKATPEESVAIGDMTADIAAAHSAGIKTTIGLTGLAFDREARKVELEKVGVSHVIVDFRDETGPLPFKPLLRNESAKASIADGYRSARNPNSRRLAAHRLDL